MRVVCSYCGKEIEKATGLVNRARKMGLHLYCNRGCAGLAKRATVILSESEKKEAKRLYDIEYRKKNKALLKVKKAEYFKKDYAANPDKYREKRKNRAGQRKKYLSTEKYKEYKRKYDARYRAEINYGPFAEAFLILNQLESIIDRSETRIDKDCHNKKQKRSKLCKSSQQ